MLNPEFLKTAERLSEFPEEFQTIFKLMARSLIEAEEHKRRLGAARKLSRTGKNKDLKEYVRR